MKVYIVIEQAHTEEAEIVLITSDKVLAEKTADSYEPYDRCDIFTKDITCITGIIRCM